MSLQRNFKNPEKRLNVKKVNVRMIVFGNNVIAIDAKTLRKGLSINVLQSVSDKSSSIDKMLYGLKSFNIKCWLCQPAVKLSYGSFYETDDNRLVLIRTMKDKFIITSAELNDLQYREVDIEE